MTRFSNNILLVHEIISISPNFETHQNPSSTKEKLRKMIRIIIIGIAVLYRVKTLVRRHEMKEEKITMLVIAQKGTEGI